jgi:uncharacterized membrane protein
VTPSRRIDLVAVGLMVAVTLVGLVLWSDLPAEIAIHWSGGSPDTYVAKPLAILGLFAFGVGTVAFVRIAPEWATNTSGGDDIGVLFLGVVFAWVQGVVLVWNLGYRFDVGLAIVPVVVLAGLLVAYAYVGTRV